MQHHGTVECPPQVPLALPRPLAVPLCPSAGHLAADSPLLPPFAPFPPPPTASPAMDSPLAAPFPHALARPAADSPPLPLHASCLAMDSPLAALSPPLPPFLGHKNRPQTIHTQRNHRIFPKAFLPVVPQGLAPMSGAGSCGRPKHAMLLACWLNHGPTKALRCPRLASSMPLRPTTKQKQCPQE